MINSKKEGVELSLDKLGAALEGAMTFMGNASTQVANLRRQRIMEGILIRTLSPWGEAGRSMTAQVPMLFRPEFMKNATQHWDQVTLIMHVQ